MAGGFRMDGPLPKRISKRTAGYSLLHEVFKVAGVPGTEITQTGLFP